MRLKFRSKFILTATVMLYGWSGESSPLARGADSLSRENISQMDCAVEIERLKEATKYGTVLSDVSWRDLETTLVSRIAPNNDGAGRLFGLRI